MKRKSEYPPDKTATYLYTFFSPPNAQNQAIAAEQDYQQSPD